MYSISLMLDHNFYRILPRLPGHGHASAARGTWYEAITTKREPSFPIKYNYSISAYRDFTMSNFTLTRIPYFKTWRICWAISQSENNIAISSIVIGQQ